MMFFSQTMIHAFPWKKALMSVILIILIFARASWGLNGADVAVYDDTSYPNGGAWKEGLDAIKTMLFSYGYTYEEVAPDDVNSIPNLNSLYRVIVFGGGWAAGYNEYIKPSGYTNIRSFVANGGAYFGICAGSYFASDIVLWKPNYWSAIEVYNYSLDLFSGIGRGVVLAIKGWTSPTGCSSGITQGAAMAAINMNTSILPDVGGELSMLYYGGPILRPFRSNTQDVQVLATYKTPRALANGAPAMILFSYGSGKVFLSGAHPEVAFDVDSCSFYYDDNCWYLMSRVLSMLMGN